MELFTCTIFKNVHDECRSVLTKDTKKLTVVIPFQDFQWKCFPLTPANNLAIKLCRIIIYKTVLTTIGKKYCSTVWGVNTSAHWPNGLKKNHHHHHHHHQNDTTLLYKIINKQTKEKSLYLIRAATTGTESCPLLNLSCSIWNPPSFPNLFTRSTSHPCQK